MLHAHTLTVLVAAAALVARPGLGAEPLRTISVSGQGKATAPPDMATIHTGVTTVASTASAALAENNQTMEKLFGVLKQHGIASKDIQTTGFHVQPEYKHDRQGVTPPQIVGYRVTNQVQVRVRNLPDLGKVLDALVQAGSNDVSGISFGIDDPTGVLNQARNRAMTDARSRAELYAHAADVRVGKVVTISEQPVAMPRPELAMARMAADVASAVPVATGEQEIVTMVHVVFALED
jgi:hypothetical protein